LLQHDMTRLGLLWIDAHLDAHTPRSSPSKRPHGMPLAMLLGEGPTALTRLAGQVPVLQAERVVVLGARSWEPAEARRLARLGVQVMTVEEVRARGLADCMARALVRVRGGPGTVLPWGLSLDVDAIDPQEAPATGTPVPDGLSVKALSEALRGLGRAPGLQALELTEYNPRLDPDCRTAIRLTALLAALLAVPDRASWGPGEKPSGASGSSPSEHHFEPFRAPLRAPQSTTLTIGCEVSSR
jgi:arginase